MNKMPCHITDIDIDPEDDPIFNVTHADIRGDNDPDYSYDNVFDGGSFGEEE